MENYQACDKYSGDCVEEGRGGRESNKSDRDFANSSFINRSSRLHEGDDKICALNKIVSRF